MKNGAFLPHGARGLLVRRGLNRDSSNSGFTLLEICTVLLILMILLGAAMPSIQSAFVEQAVRDDSHQLALMVRTAMLRSSEEHRPYAIDLSSQTMSLHPVGNIAKDKPDADDNNADASDADGVEATQQLDGGNKLVVPDPKKENGWMAMPETTWTFQPGELCPATSVRLVRGKSWIEMSFNALTGNVENESTYFP